MNSIEVFIVIAVIVALLLIVMDAQEHFHQSQSPLQNGLFKYDDQYGFDLADFEGTWVSGDISGKKQVKMTCDADYMIVSLDDGPSYRTLIHRLDSYNKIQLRISGPIDNEDIGTYDVEVMNQIPTAGDPIRMIKWKKQGDLVWSYLGKI